ncbi:AAA family ATPase [Candidatus Woesearchaeota archaeon]|nr:AAA family ATPase [Candidatus Woesearchaeota archaeon]
MGGGNSVKEINKMAKIIGITGGKGGTGKSTVSTALAVELSKKYKTLLVDMDADCPDDHIIMGIQRKKIKAIFQRIPKFDLNKCTKCGLCGTVCKTKAVVSIKGNYPIFMGQQCNGCGACFLKCPSKAISWKQKEIGWIFEGKKGSLDFLAGELKINEPVSEIVIDKLKGLLEKKKQDYDYILIDTAAGTHCDVISALDYTDFAFAVTEPTPLGRHDVELILKLLDMLKKEKKIILNRADIGDKKMIEKLAEKYKTKIAAEIPYSREVIKAYANALTIKNKAIQKIAKELE